MNTPTPRTDANESITCKEGDPCIAPDFARQLETERDELNERLSDWRSQSDEGLRLRCGELTSQEIRTVRAVLTAILLPNEIAVAPPTKPL